MCQNCYRQKRGSCSVNTKYTVLLCNKRVLHDSIDNTFLHLSLLELSLLTILLDYTAYISVKTVVKDVDKYGYDWWVGRITKLWRQDYVCGKEDNKRYVSLEWYFIYLLLFLASVHGFTHETSDFLLFNNILIYQVLCTLVYRRRSFYSFLSRVHC